MQMIFLKQLFSARILPYLISLAFGILCSAAVQGQDSAIGFGLGGISYTGDLQQGYALDQNRIAGTIFYKKHLAKPFSVRIAGTVGGIKGEDDQRDIYSVNRANSFKGIIFEGSALLEYQFFDFTDKFGPYGFSPYVFAGLAGYYLSAEDQDEANYSEFNPSIPIGVGLRFPINYKWTMDVEFSARKAYSYTLDNLSEAASTSKYTGGSPYKRDWYYYLGVHFTYTIFRSSCPTNPYF